MASANSIQTSNGAGCTQNLNTGQNLEFGTKLNTETDEGEIYAKVTIVLGQHKIKTPDCNELYNIEVQKQSLELQKMKLELELMKAQLEAAKANKTPISTGDDW
jgi:hypothetical protein